MAPDRDLAALRSIHSLRAPGLPIPGTIDDDTWRDLDIDRVFASIDRCASALGAIALYGWLRAPIQTRDQEQALRTRAQAALPLQSEPAKWKALRKVLAEIPRIPPILADALWGRHPLPTAGRWPTLLALTSLIAPLAFLISTRVGLLSVAISFTVNCLVHFRADARTQSATACLRVIHSILAAGNLLGRSRIVGMESRTQRAAAISQTLAPLSRAVFELPTQPGINDFIEYPRIALLTRERALGRASALIEQHREQLVELVELLAELDASDAVIQFRKQQSTCEPFFIDSQALELVDVCHPSLENAIANDLSLDGGMVITGSNMSGKSTFLRAIAINAITAQSLGFARATSYRGPVVRVATALRASDELSEGKSYYYAEALRLRTLLSALPAAPCALYLLDEPFRGTNSAERIAAAYGVFREMRRGGALVIAATHDFELARMLEKECQCAHFADEVSGMGLNFDYRLKRGFAGPRNAVRLLAMLGYPQDMLNDAASALTTLESNRETVR